MHIAGPALGIALALLHMLGESLAPDSGTDAPTSSNLAVPAQRDGAESLDLAALAAENAALKTALAHAKAELAAMRAAIAMPGQAAAGCQTDEAPPTAADFAASVENRRRAEAEGELALQQIADATAATFFSEGIESGWAASSVEAIHGAWQKNQADGARLIDLQCRTTLCRLEIEYTDKAVAGNVEERLLDALSTRFNTSQRQTESTPDRGDYERAVLYLARGT
jgi:hypothetical protein